MKLSLVLLSATLGLVSAMTEISTASISASSTMGQNLLSKARLLNNDDAVSYTWVANMALKFQGCYQTEQWNDEANGEDDVRVSTAKLIRFRLCPTSSCSMENAAGCTAGYGDYIIDMETYLQAYLQAVQEDHEYNCKYEEEYGDCACNNENQGDDFNEDICKYECYMAKGMEYCIENNPYDEDGGEKQEDFNIQEYAQCAQYKFNNNNNNRELENNNNNQYYYYLGPYCAESGGNVYLGLFTDDSCSQFADSSSGAKTFTNLSQGKSLPYSETTLIGSECMSCTETQQANQNNQNNGGNDANDADQIKEACETLYQASGKCEANLDIANYDSDACVFMEGIKITRKNGAIVKGAATKNTTASVFIGLFACSFVFLGGYVYYLKTKLDRAKINLSE